MRYYASGIVKAIASPPADASHRSQLLALGAGEVESVVAREGVFRDPKSTGCFVVSNPELSRPPLQPTRHPLHRVADGHPAAYGDTRVVAAQAQRSGHLGVDELERCIVKASRDLRQPVCRHCADFQHGRAES
jgi:hypothetical protein